MVNPVSGAIIFREPLKIKDSHELIDKREYADIIYRNQSQKGVDYETARII